ncbi:MAG: dTDP-4-dehydrorhamnose 3,5-epimerase [Polyangiaceae bacterium]|nr:dTDP-4-dehydrorhamnose 3,5-epimerase [Polyangiaceae bacterium]
MQFRPTEIPDVVVIEPRVFHDARGFFMETWRAERLAAAGIDVRLVQENHSSSAAGVLRGLHYQIQHAQGKLVRVVRGRVFDVAVDLRRSSPTFGRWVGVWLSEENRLEVWIPPGFAHGFYAATLAEVVYHCSDYYACEHERSVRWNDPCVAVQWPLSAGEAPVLSEKDAAAPLLEHADLFA